MLATSRFSPKPVIPADCIAFDLSATGVKSCACLMISLPSSIVVVSDNCIGKLLINLAQLLRVAKPHDFTATGLHPNL
jgi:hypothetical protein